jgi:hypothetical protein
MVAGPHSLPPLGAPKMFRGAMKTHSPSNEAPRFALPRLSSSTTFELNRIDITGRNGAKIVAASVGLVIQAPRMTRGMLPRDAEQRREDQSDCFASPSKVLRITAFNFAAVPSWSAKSHLTV